MSTELGMESEHARTIERAKRHAEETKDWRDKPGFSYLGVAVTDRVALLEIVDYQARKIEEQTQTTTDVLLKATKKIDEQAIEIERLKELCKNDGWEDPTEITLGGSGAPGYDN